MTTPTEAVIVTGASSGIGSAVAARLATDGLFVACLSRRGSVPDVDPTIADRLLGIKCDVSIEADRIDAVDHVLGLGLPLAGLVNGAGFQIQTPSAKVPLDELGTILETNLVGAFHLCQLTYEALKDNERDTLVVNIGSFYGKLGVPNFIAYSMSKAAMAAMTRTLAVEWGRDGIAVLDIAPGYIETGLNAEFLVDPANRDLIARRIPLRRVGTADEVARLVGALYKERIGFLTGDTIFIDGAHGVRL